MSKVYRSTYDGFYVVKESNGMYYTYEGLALCPVKLQEDIKSGKCEVKEFNLFHDEAIAYGYI